MTMIEKMARAIYESNEFARGWDHPKTMALWHNLCRAEAIAALKAMREPSEAMTIDGLVALVTDIKHRQPELKPVFDGQILSDEEAAQRYMHLGAVCRCGSEVNAAFTAMIDAAIAEAERK